MYTLKASRCFSFYTCFRLQVAWPLSVLVPPLALAQYQMLFRLQLEVAWAQRDLSDAAHLHKAARRLPGCVIWGFRSGFGGSTMGLDVQKQCLRQQRDLSAGRAAAHGHTPAARVRQSQPAAFNIRHTARAAASSTTVAC